MSVALRMVVSHPAFSVSSLRGTHSTHTYTSCTSIDSSVKVSASLNGV